MQVPTQAYRDFPSSHALHGLTDMYPKQDLATTRGVPNVAAEAGSKTRWRLRANPVYFPVDSFFAFSEKKVNSTQLAGGTYHTTIGTRTRNESRPTHRPAPIRDHVGHYRGRRAVRGQALQQEAQQVQPVLDEGIRDAQLLQNLRERFLQAANHHRPNRG